MARRTLYLLLASVAVVLSIGATGVGIHFKADLHAATTRVSTGSQVVQTPYGPIEYALAGSGPPLLMIHGAGGGFDQGLEFGAPLARAGFTVIAPSRFGYLRTPLPHDASPAAQADAHICLLNALGFKRVVALGGSAGAPSAIQFCLRYPQRCSAMVLVVPAIFPTDGAEPPSKPSRTAQTVIRMTLHSDLVFWLATHLARDTMIESILATPIEDFETADPEEQHRVRTILRDILPISRRAQGLWADATLTTAPSRYPFDRITAPTLIVATRNDLFGTLAGSRLAAQRIPRARLIEYPDGGHVWVGRQGEVWPAVVAFVNTSGHAPVAARQ